MDAKERVAYQIGKNEFMKNLSKELDEGKITEENLQDKKWLQDGLLNYLNKYHKIVE